MQTCEDVETKMKEYISSVIPDYRNEYVWRIDVSSISGRGVFATRDIPAGTDILSDYPLFSGPRSSTNSKPICTCCYKSNAKLSVCAKGCGLPVCSDTCGDSEVHRRDCDIILKWIEDNDAKRFTEWSIELLRVLTPLRSLHLSDERLTVMRCLQNNASAQHGFELDLLKKVGLTPRPEQAEMMREACYALDTNAFEIVKTADVLVSLRGLYPMAAMLNHCCVPNTMRVTGLDERMTFRATVDIRRGDELTTTYTSLLWGNPLRRNHLYRTKHFWCECERCADGAEFGARPSAMRCKDDGCSGLLVPDDTLDHRSAWTCDVCGARLSARHIGIIQSALGCLIGAFVLDDPVQVVTFVRNELPKYIPACNQIVTEFKYRIVWMLGHRNGYLWHELSDDYLAYKEQVCRDILDTVKALRLGQCKLRGLLLQELHDALTEKVRRLMVEQSNELRYERCKLIEDEALEMQKESSSILRDHAVRTIPI